MEANILISNCTIISMTAKGIIENGVIAIKNDEITYVGKQTTAPKITAEKLLDAQGKVAIPGLINCHTHLAMTLFRGIAEDQPLRTWLTDTIWPLEAKLQPKDVYSGALLGCLEMIKTGTTTLADMYYHEDQVAQAVEKAGLRAVLTQGTIEIGDPRIGEKTLKNSISFATKYHGYADGRVTTRLGPHAVYTCSQELLAKVRETASKLNLGIQIHLAESKEMMKQIRKEHNLGEVELLKKIGFLGSDVLAAHCIHLIKKEMKLLAMHNVKVAHNPVANMKLAQGTAKIKDLRDLGIVVGLGTDGPASNNTLDMFETMKVAALLQKLHYQDPTVLPAYTVLKMATIEAAKALGIENSIGSIEIGKKADILLIDFKTPHLTPLHNVYANIVYSAHGSDVHTVIANGKILMENREVETLNENEVIHKAQTTAFRLAAN
ncbi:MAG: amidohydrolase [Candidatus Bathyarchaeota archaeon]|nr:amidohydrolase [Candidatus Bathyarchaeota archaeon]MDH5732624.1 amidohydrolase [Candidatus Bathyarchaeota archaeon]